jgi:hypothetical protein
MMSGTTGALGDLFREPRPFAESRRASLGRHDRIAAGLGAYHDEWDEIAEHMGRLHLQLARAVSRFRARIRALDTSGLDGIVVSDREIDAFLDSAPWEFGIDEPDERMPDPDSLDAAIADADHIVRTRTEATVRAGRTPPLYRLAECFGLSDLELNALVLCLAAEVHPGYARLFAYLQNDVTRVRPSVSLVLDVLTNDWPQRAQLQTALTERAPLLRHGLLLRRSQDHEPALVDALVLEPGMTLRLLPTQAPSLAVESDARLDALLLDRGTRRAVDKVVARLTHKTGDRLMLALVGPDGSGRRALATAIALEAGARVASHTLSVGRADGEALAALRIWLRNVRLDGCWPCVEIRPFGSEDARQVDAVLMAIVDGEFEAAFLACESVPRSHGAGITPRLEVLALDQARAGLRREALQRFLFADGFACDPDAIADIATAFALPMGQLRRAAADAASRTRAMSSEVRRVSPETLRAAVHDAVEHRLDQLAERVPTVHEWTDIVLAPDHERQLREIASAVRLRERVLERWGFGEKVCTSPGLSALFFGPSGTGKTLAASILARDLGMELYRVDLSRVVSKYIGETEKNLDALFAEARRAHGILLFDEADALFGKRSEVRDAHDRYANIEVAFLLQRMESFEGVTILATNLRGNLDRAFLRRLHFAVEFGPPTEALRLQIWRRVWPPDAPLATDVDLAFLAAQFDLPGGHIRNIALRAAYLAAAEAVAVGMVHIIAATRREFQKLGRLCVDADFGAYGHLLPTAVRA